MVMFSAAAIYYSTIEPVWLCWTLAILFPAMLAGAFFIPRQIPRRITTSVLILCFWGWYLTDPPQNDRDWSKEYSIPADVGIKGHIAYIQHVRNFAWQSESAATAGWYDADYDVDAISSVDLITSYWAGNSIAHVFLSFAFKDGKHLAISIETRRQKRFPYSAIAGFFHHYELFYVVADERDLIGVRTDFRKERVYLYHLDLSPETEKRLFLSYLGAIHRLNSHPQWYNTLTDNCTTGILARAQAQWRYRLDWRILLSGYTASMAYDMGFLDTRYSFPTLMRLSRIHRPDGAVPEPNYSDDIRRNLPDEVTHESEAGQVR